MSRLPVIRGALLGLALASLWTPACSSSTQESAPTQPTQQQQSSEREAALARLRERQEAACEKVGKALFACAVEDAKATMSPEDFASLDTKQLEPEYMREFLGECLSNEMSSRQVGVYENCTQDTRCAVFVSCLDTARPQQPKPSAEPGKDGR
jgi:hypothetical protein